MRIKFERYCINLEFLILFILRIHMLLLFYIFQLIYTYPIMLEIKEFVNIFDKKSHFSINIEKLIFSSDKYKKLLECILMSMNSKQVNSSFFWFLMANIMLNKIYGEPCVPPVDLFIRMKSINDEKMQYYFLKAWLDDFYPEPIRDLKEKVINIYQKEPKYFFELGIDEIYLFGSVLKNEYTSFNDIDIIIKFKKEIININERKSIEHKLKLFNFDKFNRKSDILWFEIAKELHDIKTIYRLI